MPPGPKPKLPELPECSGDTPLGVELRVDGTSGRSVFIELTLLDKNNWVMPHPPGFEDGILRTYAPAVARVCYAPGSNITIVMRAYYAPHGEAKDEALKAYIVDGEEQVASQVVQGSQTARCIYTTKR